jgi:hypothetical protein
MLILNVPEVELYDEEKSTFTTVPAYTIRLEHSLASIAAWEAEFETVFLTTVEKSPTELLQYIKVMVLTDDVSYENIQNLPQGHIDQINEYINAKQTATTFRDTGVDRRQSEILTSEILYYWLVTFKIPFECQYWHLNRLLTLIRVCNVKNSKEKTMPKHEAARQRKDLNEKRRAQLGSSG